MFRSTGLAGRGIPAKLRTEFSNGISFMRWIGLIFVSLLAGCITTTEGSAPQQPAPQQQTARKAPSVPTDAQVTRFRQVIGRVEPVAERYCRQSRKNTNCDFNIVIDRRPNQPANAYQTLDKNGKVTAGQTCRSLLRGAGK